MKEGALHWLPVLVDCPGRKFECKHCKFGGTLNTPKLRVLCSWECAVCSASFCWQTSCLPRVYSVGSCLCLRTEFKHCCCWQSELFQCIVMCTYLSRVNGSLFTQGRQQTAFLTSWWMLYELMNRCSANKCITLKDEIEYIGNVGEFFDKSSHV